MIHFCFMGEKDIFLSVDMTTLMGMEKYGKISERMCTCVTVDVDSRMVDWAACVWRRKKKCMCSRRLFMSMGRI